MKYTLIAALVGAATVLSASAATTITATNNGGAATKQIQDNAGNPLTGLQANVYQVGTFADENDNTSTFTVAGSGTFPGTQPGIFGAFGSAGIVVDLPNTGDAAGPFVGRLIFVVIPGGPDGEFIAFKTPATFQYENALNVGAPVSVSAANLTLFRGQLGVAATGLTGPAAAGNGTTGITFQQTVIPEPSTGLLAGFAGLLLLIRRKR